MPEAASGAADKGAGFVNGVAQMRSVRFLFAFFCRRVGRGFVAGGLWVGLFGGCGFGGIWGCGIVEGECMW